jgi:hypothetical protein
MASLIEVSPELSPSAQSWLKQMTVLGQFDKGEPQRFGAEILAPNIYLYRDPSVAREGKRLIVGFCGNANRLMLPIACVLQHLPSDLCDLLVLRDPTRSHYAKGIPPYAGSMPELIAKIAADVGAESYWRRYCYGTSMGGFAALRYGLLWQADRAISIGGSFAWHPRRLLDEPHAALPPFDPLCACQTNGATALICAYGAENSKDQEEASRLSAILPVNHMAIPGLSDHNIIKIQAANGSLSAFFQEIFELGTPSAPAGRSG